MFVHRLEMHSPEDCGALRHLHDLCYVLLEPSSVALSRQAAAMNISRVPGNLSDSHSLQLPESNSEHALSSCQYEDVTSNCSTSRSAISDAWKSDS